MSFSFPSKNPCRCPSKKVVIQCPQNQSTTNAYITRGPPTTNLNYYTNTHPMNAPVVLSLVDKTQWSTRRCCPVPPPSCGRTKIGGCNDCGYTTQRDLEKERIYAESRCKRVSGIGRCPDCFSIRRRLECHPISFGC